MSQALRSPGAGVAAASPAGRSALAAGISVSMMAGLVACVAAPRQLEITPALDLGPIAALDVSIRGDGVTRCQRFTPRAAPYTIALPADLVAAGDAVAVTAIDDGEVPLGVGAGVVDGDRLTLSLAAVERPLPRAVSITAYLAEGDPRAGRQLAIADGGEAALVWLDPPQETQVQGRRIDQPSSAPPDRDLTPYRDRGRAPPVIASLGDRFAVAWIYEARAMQVDLLSTDLVPLDGTGGATVSEVGADERVYDASLVAAGGRLLAMWTAAPRGQVVGRVGLRWLAGDGGAMRAASWLGAASGVQRSPAGAALPSGDVVVGWIEGDGAAGRIRLVRVAPGDAAIPAALTLSVAGAPVSDIRTLALASDGDGVAVAWSDAGEPRQVRVVHVAVDGAGGLAAGAAVALGNQHPPAQVALASRGSHGLIAAWNERSPSGVVTAWMRWLGPGGVPEGAPRRAGLVAGGDQTSISVSGNGDGQAAIAWLQGPGPDRRAGIVGRMLAPDDATDAPALCNRPGAEPEPP